MRYQRTLLALVTLGALLVDFVYLVSISAIQGVASADAGIIHSAFLLVGFGSFAALHKFQREKQREANPINLMLRVVIATTLLVALFGVVRLFSPPGFTLDGDKVVPASMGAIILSAILSIAACILAIISFTSLGQLVFIKRRRTTKRNFQTLLLVGVVYAVIEYVSSPNGLNAFSDEGFNTVVYALLIILMIVNAFRFSWIVYLSRKEKLANLALTFAGMIFLLFFSLASGIDSYFMRSLTYYSPFIYAFVYGISIFSGIYMGIGFVSTLLHLPTAKEFDRKKVEISSLQNMGRLMTQVLDYDELTATSTQLAVEMCEGEFGWIELLDRAPADEESYKTSIIPASLQNITESDINLLKLDDGNVLQYLPLKTGKPLIVSDVRSDKRLAAREALSEVFGSIALIPLQSHKGMIGLLCIAKRNAYEFDSDVLNGLSAFADMVSIALENSKLIEQSIEKQRMEQELLVAQQMQRKLLPGNLPKSEAYEIAAVSVPAYEVGGDYYDILPLDNGSIGVVVGDVSGKGASAALYMAQVKGIFQSLGTYIHQPGDLLRRMNSTLCRNTDKKFFVSLLYGLLDTASGSLVFSRAGHCPLLHITGGESRFIKPRGMGLGLNNTSPFAESLEETRLQLHPDDLIVLYTDGITEAKNAAGEEYDQERLASIVERYKPFRTDEIVSAIVNDVKQFRDTMEAEDDMTVLVLRWNGKSLHR